MKRMLKIKQELLTSPEFLARPTPRRAKFFSISQPMAPQPTLEEKIYEVFIQT